MRQLKRILNRPEAITHERMQVCCARNGAQVFAKVRVADVFQTEHSGISPDLYGFALRAHFDFVVADRDHQPLFAVEFDGDGHNTAVQTARDRKKDSLCDRFTFPLLRINSRYLNQRYRQFDLLTWFVECFFAWLAISEAQESGALPLDEYLDPQSFVTIPGLPGRFPLWLSATPLIAIRHLSTAGRCVDPTPSFFIGIDEQGICRGVAWLNIDEDHGVLTRASMRSQRFPVSESDALHELLVYLVHDALQEVIAGRRLATPRSELNDAIKKSTEDLRMTCAGGVSQTKN